MMRVSQYLVRILLRAFLRANARFSFWRRQEDRETPFEKKKRPPALVQKKKEMLPTIHPRAQVDESYEYPAALVLPPSDIYTIDVIKLIKSQKGLRCKTEHTLLPYISMLT